MALIKRVHQKPTDGRPPITYRIQVVDEPFFKEAANFMIENFLPTENICSSIGLLSENGGIETARVFWEKQVAKGISLAAFLEDKDGGRGKMISCNVLEVERKNQEDESMKTIELSDKLKKIFQTMEETEAKADVYTLYNCEAFVHAYGLSVMTDFERRGIGAEMLIARAEICKQTDTPISATVFTGSASQRLAERCGYETIAELDITTYRIDGQIVYPKPKWPVIKWMAKRYF